MLDQGAVIGEEGEVMPVRRDGGKITALQLKHDSCLTKAEPCVQTGHRLRHRIERRLDVPIAGLVAPGLVGDRQGQGQRALLRDTDNFADEPAGMPRDHQFRPGKIRGQLNRQRQHDLIMIAVVENRVGERQFDRRRPFELAHRDAGRHLPAHLRWQSIIAGIAPISVPALGHDLPETKVEGVARGHHGHVGDQARFNNGFIAGPARLGRRGSGKARQESEGRSETGKKTHG